jgi:Rrf2 family protein
MQHTRGEEESIFHPGQRPACPGEPPRLNPVAMFLYGKTASNAISVMSYLAARPGEVVGSSEIAEARGISHALTAKLLTQLSAAGLVRGQPGPGGGYLLSKDPAKINLLGIVSLFEQNGGPSLCPFGEGWCGNGDPCPLHDSIVSLQERSRKFLEDTRLSVFSPDLVVAAGGGAPD